MTGCQKRKIRKEKECNNNSKYAKLDNFLILASSSSCASASSSNAREFDEEDQAHPGIHIRRIWDAEIILRAGQRIIFEINILVENSQGSSQIPKSNPQLLNAEIKKKIARHENIKTRFLKWGNRVTPHCGKKAVGTKSSIRKIRASSESDASNNMDRG
ncbi:hypothetical protein TNCV_3047371 [Trichonephila clavipes]|nr:hypothetical protein TNCV_3047371 [Trichonephila clavipes]